MSCCGRNKLMLSKQAMTNQLSQGQSQVLFRYTGKTRLWVRGNITRRQYHFSHSGMNLLVDAKDSSAMSQVPNLVRVSN